MQYLFICLFIFVYVLVNGEVKKVNERNWLPISFLDGLCFVVTLKDFSSIPRRHELRVLTYKV